MPSLRQLELGDFDYRRGYTSYIIRKMKMLPIEDLKLVCQLKLPQEFSYESFDDFNQALIPPGLASLQSIRLEYIGPLTTEEVKKNFEEALQLHRKRGIDLEVVKAESTSRKKAHG